MTFWMAVAAAISILTGIATLVMLALGSRRP
jgi:hypothetical protein